ncbi:YihY/virulence factor BrkB family protein [Salinimicrobium sp. MT39]|uniref:YihY/virulence factor BrkB family protein n=1 Tax=Salinimicrobium profundisediminis TaxID=2994553 RepID=A0A9X3CUH1_9FLAO|nr:YihY/virulence factor BrkB family protein [Salinimicrobium profundisediminis]MCX2836763.1 YihY/virulence factor BrkB family protein [Salinimicrobium profundisediminis]
MSKGYHSSQTVEKPSEISSSGWKSIGIAVKDQIGEDNVSIVSAGVAFYAFLAVFPAIGALVSIYGLAMDPQSLQGQLQKISQVMPQQAFEIIQTQLKDLVSTPQSALSWSLAIGILLSLWSSNKGMKSLFTGIDIAYGTNNERGFIKQNALTLLFTFGAILLVILSLGIIVIWPVIIDEISLPSTVTALITWLRWLILAALVVYFIGLIYRYAPAKPTSAFKWVLPGALIATLLWLIASWGFSFYVKNFGSYGEVYGSISAVVVMLLWLFLTSIIILIGAEINSEIEKYSRTKP